MTRVEERLSSWLGTTRAWSDEQLEAVMSGLDIGPPRHAEALRYALFAPGKRLRPALVRLACEHFGGSDSIAGPPAAAVEMIHTYSLVHDDLPAMDDDDLRRGRPTCHKVYGEAEAVLVGDSLQALAFEWLAKRGGQCAAELVGVLASAAGPAGMVGGQSIDLSGSAANAAADDVRQIHRLKTAALIGAAVEMGAVAAGADPARRDSMRGYGTAIGLCFQAQDDVLDVIGDATTLGKTPGKDEAADKATLVATLGLEGAREEARARAEEARGRAREAGCQPDSLMVLLVDHFIERTA